MASSCPPSFSLGVKAFVETSPLQVAPVNYFPQQFQAYNTSVELGSTPFGNLTFDNQLSCTSLVTRSVTPMPPGTGEGPEFRPLLRKGTGVTRRHGGCLMQVAGYLADGVSWTDRPSTADEALGSFGISLNDYADDEGRQELLPYAPRLGMSAVSSPLRRADAWTQIAADELEFFSRTYPAPIRERMRELVETTREYIAGRGPAPAPLGPLPLGLAAGAQTFSQLLSLRAAGDVHAVAQVASQVVWQLMMGNNAWGTRAGREALGVALDAHEAVLERQKWTLEQVPGAVWERLHRDMMGLAA